MAERQIVITSRTSTTFSLKVTGLDAGYTANDRIYHIFITGGEYTDKDWASYELDGGVTETPVHNLGFFLPNTVYEITVKFFTNAGVYLASVEHTTKTLQTGEDPDSGGEEETPEEPTIIIEPWSWFKKNKYANETSTKKAYEALTNKGSIGDFSYSVWNDLCYKGLEIADYMESTYVDWADYFMFTNNLLMTSKNKSVTASNFNTLIKAMKAIRVDVSAFPTVKPGDLIYAHYFLDLATEINERIAQINK